MLKNNHFYDNQKEEELRDADHVRACAQRAPCGLSMVCVPLQCLRLLSLFCNFMQSVFLCCTVLKVDIKPPKTILFLFFFHL